MSRCDNDMLSAPDSKAGVLQRACLELLREHHRKGDIPTNGRFLFYELEQRGTIPKKYDEINPKTGNKFARMPLQDVSVATMHLRESGLVPWSWIEDESRHLYRWRYATTVLDYLIKRYIEKHTGRIFGPDEWAKIALTEKQVKASVRLCRLGTTKLDRRCKPPKAYEAIECEALGQGVLVRIICKHLDRLLSEPLDVVRERECRQRELMLAALLRIRRKARP
jgi:hypothetical protein